MASDSLALDLVVPTQLMEGVPLLVSSNEGESTQPVYFP